MRHDMVTGSAFSSSFRNFLSLASSNRAARASERCYFTSEIRCVLNSIDMLLGLCPADEPYYAQLLWR
jgi:hypothetical protein